LDERKRADVSLKESLRREIKISIAETFSGVHVVLLLLLLLLRVLLDIVFSVNFKI
jgi:membrane protein required for beta-lactamase induction